MVVRERCSCSVCEGEGEVVTVLPDEAWHSEHYHTGTAVDGGGQS